VNMLLIVVWRNFRGCRRSQITLKVTNIQTDNQDQTSINFKCLSTI
jgi:hypothetical protein